MRPLDDANTDDESLPVDGLEVEEVRDEDTIREFVAAWRRRVSREYALSLLREASHRPAGPTPR